MTGIRSVRTRRLIFMARPVRTVPVLIASISVMVLTGAAPAQQREPVMRGITGRVLEAETGAPIPLAEVRVEGTRLRTLTDSAGTYRLADVPPGPHVLVVERLGYATARVPLTVPATGTLARDIRLATRALEVEGLIVTADPAGRARGELGTASVIDREAIANQSAASLAGVLELVPGIPLQPPGLDGVQQISLRAVPTATTAGVTLGGPTASDLSSFGTLIILDGVPLSNNANLQTTGPRGELAVPSSARGGIDLRRIPASTIERVEVIRGVPSARYGDLTQGAIVVDTRAGRTDPTLMGRYDARLTEGSAIGGTTLSAPQTLSATFDVAGNRIAPGVRDDQSLRLSAQLAHRAELGGPRDANSDRRAVLDSRLDYFQVRADNPERPDVIPGLASRNRDSGLRLSERARVPIGSEGVLELTTALDYTRRRSFAQQLLIRGGMPFTDRLTEGRSVGKFIGGEFPARVDIDGDEWLLFARLELDEPASWWGFNHRVRAGTVFRREWNVGDGLQFDIEFPPQVTFNGVQGFDRPRSFDDLAPLANSAFYLDDRLIRVLPGDIGLDVQAGLRLDLLYDGGDPFSGVRDAVLQPRFNLQIAPWSWLRARGGWGRTAKLPSLDELDPARQYFDVVNVNFFADDPAERLAVLTTFIRDPTSPNLGFATGRKAELGLELAPQGTDLTLSVVGFSDRTTGGVGFRQRPDFLLRERFQVTDSVGGNGEPPEIIEPAFQVDTVPILIDRPANNLTLESEGVEFTALLPELRPIRTRLEIQGAWIRTKFFKRGLDFGANFSEFQLDERIRRAPFWEDPIRNGELALFTYRVVHHQPAIGLVITATVEHIAKEVQQNVAGTDSLAFVGYITRTGRRVRVPAENRTKPEFEDLRRPRLGTFTDPEETPADWLMSLQVSKTLPGGGRLSFFAFNVLDRMGRFSETGFSNRFFPGARFGVEASLPLMGIF